MSAEIGTLLVHRGLRGADLLRELVEGARQGGFGSGLVETPVAELAAVLERVRELESYTAQLLDQRDSALNRRDELGEEATRLRGERAALVAALGTIDRSLDVQVLEADVLEAAEALAAEVAAALDEGRAHAPSGPPVGDLLATYREARARLDALDDEREDGRERYLASIAPACRACECMGPAPCAGCAAGGVCDGVCQACEALGGDRGGPLDEDDGEEDDEECPGCGARMWTDDARGDEVCADCGRARASRCETCGDTRVVEEVPHQGTSTCDPGDVREVPCPECSAEDRCG